jgi:primosomal replication protein N
VNRLQLQAVVVQVQSLRYTPAGIPALNLVLEHESQQTELDTPRTVKVQLRAVAFGALAEALQRQALNDAGHFDGFLANARTGKGVVFHIQAFSKT